MNVKNENAKNPFSELVDYSFRQGNDFIKEIELRYSFENNMIKAVSAGNYKALRDSISVDVFLSNVEKRTDDNLRNLKNYMVIFNTLLRKGVEVGNVHPFYIHNLSSDFAKKIELCKNEKEIEMLWGEMAYAYCKLVKDHKDKGYSPLIKNVVMLIDSDLTADLSLKGIADALGANASYLSSVFKKETGQTLTDFVNMKRISHAKYLLTNTDLSVSTVGQHCGITDNNYFSKIFKKHTGKTPKEFRIRQSSEHIAGSE
ncbi:MAG: helix-turn-helix transcriptional regulator [Clostridia bacterium]|nr:helix-turn-helix transcriptional regulator [Clostridia bacterium]MBQ7296670.1 helix-turn-helix transcriptional regulator [Clostridia bacterium]